MLALATLGRSMTGENHCERDVAYLRLAARLALRGHGRAEPNPLVGCVIVNDDDTIVGWGYHARFGGLHAEIEALRRAGSAAKNATCYVTLEPCNHTGKTGPCTAALIDAGVRRVVIGRRDTTELAAGGAEQLCAAGIDVCILDHAPQVRHIAAPFFHHVETGRPWVVAKWAQTLDGCIATRTGDSQWISCLRSRAMVHRQRGRIDVIMTGIGTVLHDNPTLNARCRTVRRVARRVVVDPNLEIPMSSKLVQTAGDIPVTVFCTESAYSDQLTLVQELKDAGVDVVACGSGDEVTLETMLKLLATDYRVFTVLVEAGAGLMGRLFDQQLINEAWVFIGPTFLGDEQALSPARGRTVNELTAGVHLDLIDCRRRDTDVMLRYRVR